MISVIIPVYNTGKYIDKTLECLDRQSFKDFELLLVDDGSTDNSIEVAETFLEGKDIDYKILKKENGGQSSARNHGLRSARGEYIVFLDSDDVISDDFLERLYDAFDEQTDFTFCAFQYVKQQCPPDDDSEKIDVFDKEELIERFLKRTIAFVVPSMMLRKSFLLDNDLFFREEIRYSEDQLFIWEAIFKAEKSIYLERKMYGYYLREKSIMTASPFDKICKGFEVYSSFCDELKDKYPEYQGYIEKILPRWELGTLYTSVNLLEYSDYKKIYELMDGRSILKRISGIGELKAYLLAMISALSCRLLYSLCKRMDLNG